MTEHSPTTVAGFDLIDVACVVITVAVAVAVGSGQHGAFRAVVGVAFSLFVPGRAIISNWPSMAARPQVALSVLFSLTVLTLVATLTLWAGHWHPLGLLEVECVASGLALVVALARQWRDHGRSRTETRAELAEPPESGA